MMALATHCRTATTPTGPSTGKASAAIAAPSWADTPLPVISAMPTAQSRCAPAAVPEAAVPAAFPCAAVTDDADPRRRNRPSRRCSRNAAWT